MNSVFKLTIAMAASKLGYRIISNKVSSRLTIDILQTFPLFTPNSAGGPMELADITIDTINRVLPRFSSLRRSVMNDSPEIEDFESLMDANAWQPEALALKKEFDKHGSDKATTHNYHRLYGYILQDRLRVSGIFEVGLGTNNTDVVSHMGPQGTPGASLRAFRNFCPNAVVHGGDVDERILFSEDRIETFFVDQTDPSSFAAAAERLLDEYDLIIDDGLHTIDANLLTLEFGLKRIKSGGWVVIEDIPRRALPAWEIARSIVTSEKYSCYLFDSGPSLAFAVRRN